MLNIRSTSSITKYRSVWGNSFNALYCRDEIISHSRPTVATNTLTPSLITLFCFSSLKPPTIHPIFTFRQHTFSHSFQICSASSLVGVTTKPPIPVVVLPSSSSSSCNKECNMGRPNANVLPLLVGAAPMISRRPNRDGGRVAAWMGVGVW